MGSLTPAWHTRRPAWLRYGVALVLALVALLLRILMLRELGIAAPFITFFPAVLLSAWYGGFGPGLLTTALSAFLAVYYFVPPLYSPAIDTATDTWGLVRFIVGSVLITGMMRALVQVEERERASQRWAAVTLASIGDAVLTTDMAGRISFMNPVAAVLTGWPAAEALKQDSTSVFRIFDEQTGARLDNPVDRVLFEGVSIGLANHTLLEKRSGERIPIDDCAAPIRDEDGRITGAVLIFRDIAARRRAEQERRAAVEELARSQKQMRGMLESITDGFASLDRQWRYTFGNAEAARQSGMASEDMIGRSIWDLFPGVVGTPLYQDLQRSMAEQIPVTCEVSTRDKRTLRIRAYPSSDGLSLYSIDVTSEKQAAATNALLAAVVESSGDAIISTDLDGVITTWNRAASQIFGYPAAEMIGKPVALLEPEGEYRDMAGIMDRIKRGERIEQYETVRRASDGRLVDIALTVSPILDSQGRITGASRVARDITERKASERALRNSEARLAMALEAGSMGVFEWEIRSGKVTWSPQLESIHGLRPGSFGETIEDFLSDMHPDDVKRVLEDLRHSLDTRTGYTTTYRITRPDGQSAWLESRGRVVLGQHDEPERVRGIVMDITDRKRTEEELLLHAERLSRSNTDLQAFAYAASHDLQEPLRNIATFTALLAKRYKGKLDADADEFITYVVDSAVRMGTLIRDLLSYSRLISRDEIPSVEVELKDAVEWALRNLRTAVAESGASVDLGLLPPVRGDRTQLAQLFQNLIGNSIKYRGSQPLKIRIAAAQINGSWVVSVSDNGIGIDPAYHDKIFGVFKRLHGSEYPGTGIGLALCKRIVEQHGGRIWVESEPGKGATFHFSIAPINHPQCVEHHEVQ